MENKTVILTWQEIVGLIAPGVELDQKGMSSLITQARQLGIGKVISFQKTAYSQKDLDRLKIIINWWNFLNKSTIPELRDLKTEKKIQKLVIESVGNKKPLIIYSIFCPSYKKGKGAYGYRTNIGKNTKAFISKLISFINCSSDFGLDTSAKVYFSDLLLENYLKLKGTNYQQDLEKNYQDFKKEVLRTGKGKIKISKLSSFKEIQKKIGEKGILGGPIGVPRNVYETVFTRNKIFYLGQLGWNEKMVKERTSVLARCYSFMGEALRKKFPKGIMFWTESAYERGKMYSGFSQENPLPIIYPQKNE